jgi:Stage II sporulation protein
MRASGNFSNLRAIRFALILILAAGVLSVSALPTIQPNRTDQRPALAAADVASLPPSIPTQVGLEGWVKDSAGVPVSGAVVRLSSLQVWTDATGYFSFAASQIDRDNAGAKSPVTLAEVTVSAAGLAPWSISGVRYYPGDVVRLYPKLSTGKDANHVVAAASAFGRGNLSASFAPAFAANGSILAGSISNVTAPDYAPLSAPQAVPDQIRVYRTGTGEVEVVPFKDYVKHVLPNEWIPTWPQASLRAGAMAVKEYAWYWVARGGKQVSLGADVKDNTDDQVYDPNVSYASSDAAVDATWQYSMTRDGALFQASYCAGSYQADPSADCPWNGSYMTQWGTKFYADQGQTWGWIVQFYYTGVSISPTPPGGGGVPQPPQPPNPPAPTRVPVGGPVFTVGQGATDPSVFQAAYDRNGGAAVLGRPTGTVKWWLQYVTENNVLAQSFSSGNGTAWIVFDTLKNNLSGINRAYVVTGAIGNAYASHDPQGPEWIGAPTSDPYTNATGVVSQGFTKGTLSSSAQGVELTLWPTQFSGWEADYFVGKPPTSLQNGPLFDLPGQPANVTDVAAPDMNWAAGDAVPRRLGVGQADWSAQFTRDIQVSPGSYDFTLGADSGTRLWIDGLLTINS